jgi:hypothetical protein
MAIALAFYVYLHKMRLLHYKGQCVGGKRRQTFKGVSEFFMRSVRGTSYKLQQKACDAA